MFVGPASFKRLVVQNDATLYLAAIPREQSTVISSRKFEHADREAA
jgi:hypothetical protein